MGGGAVIPVPRASEPMRLSGGDIRVGMGNGGIGGAHSHHQGHHEHAVNGEAELSALLRSYPAASALTSETSAELRALEEKMGEMERKLGAASPTVGIALLFLARAWLKEGTTIGLDRALLSLFKALQTMQVYVRSINAPVSIQASKMFDGLRASIMEAKGQAMKTQEAANNAMAALKGKGGNK